VIYYPKYRFHAKKRTYERRGNYERRNGDRKAFTYAYMTTVPDAKKLLASIKGLRTETVIGQESILSPYRKVLAECPKKIREAWYEYALRFCEKEEFLTHTEHLMIVSVKE
jgi:hypothetical protein